MVLITNVTDSKILCSLTINDDGSYNRTTLCPGEFERAKQILNDEQYNEICQIWTENVVNAFNEEEEQIRDSIPTIDNIPLSNNELIQSDMILSQTKLINAQSKIVPEISNDVALAYYETIEKFYTKKIYSDADLQEFVNAGKISNEEYNNLLQGDPE
jgi:uncharacterized XkdX family phage protein